MRFRSVFFLNNVVFFLFFVFILFLARFTFSAIPSVALLNHDGAAAVAVAAGGRFEATKNRSRVLDFLVQTPLRIRAATEYELGQVQVVVAFGV